MFRLYITWLLFLSSYAPFFLIMAIRTWGNWILVGILLAIALLSTIVLLLSLRFARRLEALHYEVTRVQTRTADTTGYIASYLIPFIPATNPGRGDMVAVVVLLAVLGTIYVRSNLIYINPMLNVFGYGLYEIFDTDGRSTMLVARDKPVAGTVLRGHEIADSVILERSDDGARSAN